MPGPDRLFSRDDGGIIDESRRPQIDIHSLFLKCLRRCGRVDLLNGCAHIVADLSHVSDGRRGDDAVLCRRTNHVRYLGYFQQGLARHTACPSAVSADAVTLNQSDLGSELNRQSGGDQAARPGTDDGQVIELFRHLNSPETQWSPASNHEGTKAPAEP